MPLIIGFVLFGTLIELLMHWGAGRGALVNRRRMDSMVKGNQVIVFVLMLLGVFIESGFHFSFAQVVSPQGSPSLKTHFSVRQKVDYPIKQFQGMDYCLYRCTPNAAQLSRVRTPQARSQCFYYDVKFNRLSEDQFCKLKSKYWPDNPLELKNRPYDLAEFFPPVMQALLNVNFGTSEQYLRTIRRPKHVKSDWADIFLIRPFVRCASNCWTTAYEVLRKRKSRYLHFFASDRDVMNYLGSGDPSRYTHRDTRYSKFIKELPFNEACVHSEREPACPLDNKAQRNSGLAFGDLLLVRRAPDLLDHAAIYVADDLYFEKGGAKADYLVRLNLYPEIRKLYRDHHHVFQFRRFWGDGLTPLPDPRAVFGRFDQIERDVDQAIPKNLRHRMRAIHQPSENSARDVALYTFTDIPLLKSPGSSGFQLVKRAKDRNFFINQDW